MQGRKGPRITYRPSFTLSARIGLSFRISTFCLSGNCCAIATAPKRNATNRARGMASPLPARRRRLADGGAVAQRSVERPVLEVAVVEILVVVGAGVLHDDPVF